MRHDWGHSLDGGLVIPSTDEMRGRSLVAENGGPHSLVGENARPFSRLRQREAIPSIEAMNPLATDLFHLNDMRVVVCGHNIL